MPHLIQVAPHPSEPKSMYMYQIDSGVGKNRPNKKEDVAIVQLMLSVLRTIYSGGPEVSVDGICGPNTIASIAAFQKWYRDSQPAFQNLLALDSAVDPTKSPIGAHRPVSTLAQLNYRCAMHIYAWPNLSSISDRFKIPMPSVFG